MKTYYRPGELSRLAGVSTDTLRHYERLGLIARAHRSSNGYREYPIDALERVRVIQSALAIGFTLAELSRIFRIRERGGIPCREVRDLARNKSVELEDRIRQMKRLLSRLRDLISGWDGLLEQAGPGVRARLLESLGEATLDSGVHHHLKKTVLRRNK